MTEPEKTIAGRLLYRHLPEEYRYRDLPIDGEPGDLETFLDGFGHLLDLFQGTLAQAYADAFAEALPNKSASQPWILPYLASLLGNRLASPDLDGLGTIRRRELNHIVAWSKGKGTLRVTDSVADVLADAEAVVVEGWRRTAITPRLTLPPFSLPTEAAKDLPDMVPLGTPDLRFISRAVADPDVTDPLRSFRLVKRDSNGHHTTTTLFWKLTSRRGAPCLPNSYADASVTTPDIRTSGLTPPGPAPRRVTVYVQPQAGFFEPDMKIVGLTQTKLDAWLDANPPQQGSVATLGPEQIYTAMGLDPKEAPDRITLSAGFEIGATRNVAFQDVNIMATVTVKTGGRFELDQVALARAVVEAPGGAEPSLDATNSLFGRISGPGGFARLEYVTVRGETQLGRLQASDCLFVGKFDDPGCFDAGSCVRYSRIPAGIDADKCVFAKSLSNTDAVPRFVQRPIKSGGICQIRAAVFGKPGCGVLDHSAPAAIRQGSEDGMEMGAYHSRGYAARLSALERKLADQVPLGQTVSLRHDPILAVAPPDQT